MILGLSDKISHFVELFDDECLFMFNLLGIPRSKCLSIYSGGPATTFRDKELLKQLLGI
jgi:hypothetical protein